MVLGFMHTSHRCIHLSPVIVNAFDFDFGGSKRRRRIEVALGKKTSEAFNLRPNQRTCVRGRKKPKVGKTLLFSSKIRQKLSAMWDCKYQPKGGDCNLTWLESADSVLAKQVPVQSSRVHVQRSSVDLIGQCHGYRHVAYDNAESGNVRPSIWLVCAMDTDTWHKIMQNLASFVRVDLIGLCQVLGHKIALRGGAPQASWDKRRHPNCFQTRPLQDTCAEVRGQVIRSNSEVRVHAGAKFGHAGCWSIAKMQSAFMPELHRWISKLTVRHLQLVHQEIFWSPW